MANIPVGTERYVVISISNNSEKYILRNPRVYNYTGYSHDPPQPTIRKGTMGACSFTKNPDTQSGYTGVLMYEVAHDEDCPTTCCIAIMCSVPQDYNNYENMLAVGVFDANQICDESLYKLMYYDTGPFIRYNCTGSEIKFEKNCVAVKGTMCPRTCGIAKIELWGR